MAERTRRGRATGSWRATVFGAVVALVVLAGAVVVAGRWGDHEQLDSPLPKLDRSAAENERLAPELCESIPRASIAAVGMGGVEPDQTSNFLYRGCLWERGPRALDIRVGTSRTLQRPILDRNADSAVDLDGAIRAVEADRPIYGGATRGRSVLAEVSRGYVLVQLSGSTASPEVARRLRLMAERIIDSLDH
jgi:hypothetical protein